MRRSALILTALLAACLCVPAPAAAEGDPLLPPRGSCPGDEAALARAAAQRTAMYCLVLSVRKRARMRTLQPTTELGRSAGLKARRIAACRFFTHHPCGDSVSVPFQRARLARERAWLVGEDLAWQPYGKATARSVLDAWLASSVHRAVMLDPRFTHIGVRLRRVALQDAPSGIVIWVAHLGTPVRS